MSEEFWLVMGAFGLAAFIAALIATTAILAPEVMADCDCPCVEASE